MKVGKIYTSNDLEFTDHHMLKIRKNLANDKWLCWWKDKRSPNEWVGSDVPYASWYIKKYYASSVAKRLK